MGTTGQTYEQAQLGTEQNTLKEIPFINEQANPKAGTIDTGEATGGEAKEVKVKGNNFPSELTDNAVGEESVCTGGLFSFCWAFRAGLSLRGKPPDVSTEAFLTNLSIQSKQEDTVESKERVLKQLLQDQENNLQDNRTSNTSPPL